MTKGNCTNTDLKKLHRNRIFKTNWWTMTFIMWMCKNVQYTSYECIRGCTIKYSRQILIKHNGFPKNIADKVW